ncbi:family 24 glycosyltransferase [Melampsora americana]|nr:family 24 glycosyltransferase [Melampsora americana]
MPKLGFHQLGSYAGVICWTILQVAGLSPPISVSIQATWPEPPLLIQIMRRRIDERRILGAGTSLSSKSYLGPLVDHYIFSSVRGRDRPAPRILPFDHISPSGSHLSPPSVPVVILYASNDPYSFGPFHDVLHQASRDSPIRATYIFRWQVSSQDSHVSSVGPSHLSGWAARLDIKKSDYLTVDDRPVETRDSRESDSVSQKEKTKEDGPETSTVITPLQADEFSTIGLEKELMDNAAERIVKPGQSAIWINGLDISSVLPVANINFFKLIQLMRDERRWIKSLTSLGLSVSEIQKLITDERLNSALSGEDGTRSDDSEIDPSILGERFDASDRLERGETILWLNDLEKDKRYASWPKSLRDFLRPTYPGQLHAVARNTITVILALNVTHTANLRILTESVETFITRSVPIRWGLVPLIDLNASRSSEALQDTVIYNIWKLFHSRGPIAMLQFLKQFIGSTSSDMVDALDFKQRANAYREAHHASDSDHQEVTDTLGEGKFNAWSEKAQSYARRLALCSGSGGVHGCMLVNGKFFVLDDDFRMNLQQTAMLHIQFIQHQIYYGLVQGDADVSNYLYDLPGVYTSRNEFVFPSPGRPLLWLPKLGSCGTLFTSEVVEPTQETDNLTISAIWVIGDLDSKSGAASVLALLELIQTDSHKDSHLSDSLAQLIHSSEPSEHLDQECDGSVCSSWFETVETISGIFVIKQDALGVEAVLLEIARMFGQARSLCSLNSTSLRVVSLVPYNSPSTECDHLQVLDVPHGQALQASDFHLLIEYESQKRTNPLQVALRSVLGLERFTTIKPMIPYIDSVISSVLVPSDEEARRRAYGRAASNALPECKHSSVSYGDNDAAILQFRVILNPATLSPADPIQSQRRRHQSLVQSCAPRRGTSDQALPFAPHFTAACNSTRRALHRLTSTFQSSSVSPSVAFRHMPTDVLLTLSIEAPPAWLALPLESVHDLDNIMLSKIGSAERERGVEGVFQLEHIIIAGHATELPSEAPPRGLQVVLTNVLTSASVDTIIMANLGYFQFKAEPGMFVMKIRPGRSSELYALERVDLKMGKDGSSTDKNKTEEDHQFSLTTFDGLLLFPRFRKRPGKEKEKLIKPVAAMSESDDANTSATHKLVLTTRSPLVTKRAAGILKSKSSDVTSGKQRNVINVFTVASGLLYERMAYLMCVSVMRHTKSDVKSRKYEFEYELVTYHWPPWLRAQKEKQRVIWGYKILFLDVLFPLELDRVIFVDSDQIVRTDLQELVDLDLRGAPYAYTPMCNDREETKGFRFWDTGYWKDSLQGRPYHISALYVVDLRVFRAVAAGDQLRQHYQALSADPNSLANLDQDLPNNMQEVLPIHSLDQTWLWCETWCSDDGLKTAKTIDLCNNPLTHEPKLTRARRLIPEWDIYDKEVAELARQKNQQDDVLDDESLDQTAAKPVESEIHSKDEL